MPTKTVEEYGERIQLEAVRENLTVSVPVTVKNGFKCEQGDVLGRITSSSLYRRRSRTTVDTTAFGTGSATGKVADPSVFADGDVLKKVDGTLVGTIAVGGINLVTKIITLTANAAVAVADGLPIVASDGSQIAEVIADKDSDGNGDTPINAFIGGFLEEAKLSGLDSTAKDELGGKSTANGIFKF